MRTVAGEGGRIMSTIDHKARANRALEVARELCSATDALIGQGEATLALVSATEKQTAVLTLIFSAMQTGMTNHQRAELNEAMTA